MQKRNTRAKKAGRRSRTRETAAGSRRPLLSASGAVFGAGVVALAFAPSRSEAASALDAMAWLPTAGAGHAARGVRSGCDGAGCGRDVGGKRAVARARRIGAKRKRRRVPRTAVGRRAGRGFGDKPGTAKRARAHGVSRRNAVSLERGERTDQVSDSRRIADPERRRDAAAKRRAGRGIGSERGFGERACAYNAEDGARRRRAVPIEHERPDRHGESAGRRLEAAHAWRSTAAKAGGGNRADQSGRCGTAA